MNNIWNNLHKHYSTQNWISKQNIFANEAVNYFPASGKLLSLGDGQGQDGRFFAAKGYEVYSTDISDSALKINLEKAHESGIKNIKISKIDLKNALPFEDNLFDVVYAHLSLHYFDSATTQKIFDEANRILKRGGVIAVFTNSKSDPEYGTGKMIERDYYEIEGITKRFFSVDTIKTYIQKFNILLLDNKGETYKDSAKGVHNLIRFIGKKN